MNDDNGNIELLKRTMKMFTITFLALNREDTVNLLNG